MMLWINVNSKIQELNEDVWMKIFHITFYRQTFSTACFGEFSDLQHRLSRDFLVQYIPSFQLPQTVNYT